jgi:predicted outer membrane repeat protein
MMMRLTVAALLVSLATPSSLARTWYITPDGTGDAPTIQAGVDSAAAGDTVFIAPGTYTDCTHDSGDGTLACAILKSGVSLLGETGNPVDVTIDAQGIGRVLRLVNGVQAVEIRGLTITNGSAAAAQISDFGGGLFCENSSVILADCRFAANDGANAGGGVWLGSCPLAVVDGCEFEGNQAANGAGLYCHTSTASLTGCTFLNNVGQKGGGLRCHQSSLEVIASLFTGNIADLGGAYYCGSSVSGTACSFSGNTASTQGGAVYWDGGGVLTGCTLRGNSAPQGGAMYTRQPLTVLGCTFAYNSALQGGGVHSANLSRPELIRTIVAYSASGGAVFGDATLTCCDVFGNVGGDWTGFLAPQLGSDGNFSGAPEFCDGPNGNLTLSGNSPCLPGNHPDGATCGLIGALGEGCGPISVEQETWAGIKARYRAAER